VPIAARSAAEELERELRRLVGLREDRDAGLGEHLLAGEVRVSAATLTSWMVASAAERFVCVSCVAVWAICRRLIVAPKWLRVVLRFWSATSSVLRRPALVTLVPVRPRPLESTPPKFTVIWSFEVPKMPTWKLTVDPAPARRFWPLKFASPATRSISSMSCWNSVSRFALSLALIVPFWASTARTRMRVRSAPIWSDAPSAVCTMLMASAAFCCATVYDCT